MKKIIALTAIMIFTASFSAFGAALATGSVTSTGGLSIYGGVTAAEALATGVLIGKTSKGVKMGANYISTAYCINTKHDSGSKGYGTAYDSTAIYFIELGTAALTAPSANSNTSFSTWTSM